MSIIIKTGEQTFNNGEVIVSFDSSFPAVPTVTCSSISKNVNIYIKNITTTNFTVSASTSDSVSINYIAILKQ